ncbi:MAG: MG2 domain-containing protein [Bacteroidales bacterium]
MRKILYLLIIVAGASLLAIPVSNMTDDKKMWVRIDSLESAGLYRSALRLTEQIYLQARNGADTETEIKSLIYRLKYTQELEEDGPLAAISLLEKELPDNRLLPAALKNSMLAELYYRYYSANRWQINQNPTEDKGPVQSIKTWSPERFYTFTLNLYKQSLQMPDTLSGYPVGSLPGLWSGNLADTVNKPYIFDILISRALEFVEHASEFSLPELKPSLFCSSDLFSEPSQFFNTGPDPKVPGTNPYLQAIDWYGLWLRQKDKVSALVPDLQRLRYVYEQSCNVNRDSLYESALKRWLISTASDSSNAIVCEALAQFHLDKANGYQINSTDTAKYMGERKSSREWLKKAINWPETLAGKRCQNLLTSLIKPELSVQSEFYQIPSVTFPVSVEYRNLKTIHYRITRMPAIEYYANWNDLQQEEKLNRIAGLKTVKTGSVELPDDGLMNQHRANVILDPLPSGFYLLVFTNQGKEGSEDKLMVAVPVTVTRTTFVSRTGMSKGIDFYFRDRDNGAVLANLEVIPWFGRYDQVFRRMILEKGKSNNSGAEGYLFLPDGNPGRNGTDAMPYRLEIINRYDTLITQEMFYPGNHQGKIVTRTNLHLFTDRSLYNPGDETFFRGVLVDYMGDSMAIHRGDSIVLSLQDPRYQVIEKLVLPVDSMGVFTGFFKLPFKGLTGNYLIQSKFGQTAIRMEQIRRPAFSISILPNREIFQAGGPMYIHGVVNALSGEPVPAATVQADIYLQPVWGPRKWSPYSGQKMRITTVKSTTDNAGGFICKWSGIPESADPFGDGSVMRYSIQIKVTDINGESHQEETMIDSGKGSVRLVLNIPERILNIDTLAGNIRAYSNDGRNVKVPVRFIISKLKDPVRTWIKPVLPEPDRFTVSKKNWQKRILNLPYKDEHVPSTWSITGKTFESIYPNDSITNFTLPLAGKWPKGWYKVDVIPFDPKICKTVTRFIFIENEQPVKFDGAEDLYARPGKKDYQPGQTLNLDLASNKKGFLMVEVRKSGSSQEAKWYPVDQRISRLTWLVSNDWQGGVSIHVIMLRSNRVFEESIPIAVPWENSELIITGFEKIKTLKPGENASVRLLVRDKQGTPVSASLGITIYDASLDQIFPHQWSPIRHPVPVWGASFQVSYPGSSGSLLLVEPVMHWIEVGSVEPITLNWFGLGYYGISRMDQPMMKIAMARPESAGGRREGAEGVEDVKGVTDVKNSENGENIKNETMEEVREAEIGGIVLRSDFRETALFDGNILTGNDGIAEISFTVPDVFTEWKVLVTGHDKKMAVGNFEHKFKSVKDLMLKSNFPTFMRKGDTVELSARLGWYGQDQIEAITSLRLTDSIGGRLGNYPPVHSSLSKGGVVPFYWPLTVQKTEPVVYQIQSNTPEWSDGLRDTIKIYPDEIRLWTAQPFFLSKPGKRQLNIEGNPLEAMFEVTTTPAWQVLQSLPIVADKERDCSEYWFSRLYLASLAGNIADRFPSIADKFLSDSVPETQKDRIRQLREWMNPDTRAVEFAYVLEKLSNLQNSDGTWPWYKGMGPDLFMTQEIIAGFGELKNWGIFDVTITQRGTYMVTQAIEAMDNWMYREFREVIRRDSITPQKVHLNPLIIHYLHARSFYTGLTLSPSNEIAWLYFIDRIPLEWMRHSPGLQALLGTASVQLGHMPNAIPIYKSLRERAKVDEQWGMYWPRKGFASAWFGWDLWMQSRMIELFACVEDGRKDLDQLKLYLIHQKRGRDWGNGMVAAWASKSLLFYGTKLAVSPATVSMEWGGEKYSTLRIKTGSMGVQGYYRYDWKNADVIPKSRTMEVIKAQGGPAWGTLYTLNNYELNKLSETAGPLSVTREVLVRDERGSWTRVKIGQTIRVGDLVRIRLTVSSDRELSYIEIRDHLATGFMPVQVLSGYQYRSGLSYYQSREPESVVCYVSQLPKGSNVIDYQVVAEQGGSYFGGYATATSLYAPEFRGWSNSIRIHSKR